jgi:phosphoglycerate kinase
VKAFRASLTKLGDVYANDAFGTAHRAHSSMTGVGLPAAGGRLPDEEGAGLPRGAVDKPKRPSVAIIGGARVSGKIDVIESLLPKVDQLVIGGRMAFTFYKAQGKEVGGSLVEDDRVEMAKALLAKAGGKLVLPVDTVVTDVFDFDARKVGTLRTVAWDAIGSKDIGVDIGEKTREKFASIMRLSGGGRTFGHFGRPEPEVVENPSDRELVCEEGDDLHRLTAAGADERIDLVDVRIVSSIAR